MHAQLRSRVADEGRFDEEENHMTRIGVVTEQGSETRVAATEFPSSALS